MQPTKLKPLLKLKLLLELNCSQETKLKLLLELVPQVFHLLGREGDAGPPLRVLAHDPLYVLLVGLPGPLGKHRLDIIDFQNFWKKKDSTPCLFCR